MGGRYARYLKPGEQSVPQVLKTFAKNPIKSLKDSAHSASNLDKALITGGAALELPKAMSPQKPGDRGAGIGGALGMLGGGLIFNKTPLVANIAGSLLAGGLGSGIGRKLSGG